MKVAASGWVWVWVWVWLYLLVLVLARASQIRAQTSVLPQISTTSTSASQDLTEDLWRDGDQTTHIVTETKTSTAAVTTPVSTTQAGPVTTASASESPSVTPSPLSASTTQTPGHTFSSQPASSSSDRTPSALSSTEPLLLSLTPTTVQQRSQGIAGSAHQEEPSQLNVGDEDLKGSGHRPSSLDPLLAGLLSVFVVTTAVIFVFLFLRFRHQNNNPEFHRLQDLPMDDLMEDTPLSRYTY